MKREEFLSLILLAFEKEVIKKLVFSRPEESEIAKVCGRLCAHRGKRILALEYSLPQNTVSHKNLSGEELKGELFELIGQYRQVNLYTLMGDAEYKRARDSREVCLGLENLKRKLNGDTPAFVSSLEELDKKKNYILRGDERFLVCLGISSKDGRVHDKKQGKFRQINRFLEHIDEIYPSLPKDGEISVYDLCCGKSYLSFAVYYYLTEIKQRRVSLYGADLKRDVILWCEALAKEIGFVGMRFEVGDITRLNFGDTPDMVVSLHACDVATDVVLDTAVRLGAPVILSTPCCHRYLNGKVTTPALAFVNEHAHISNKLSEALTDALRALRLKASGYNVSVLELTDPENTPKNTLIRAVKNERMSEEKINKAKEEYRSALEYLLGDGAEKYLSEIR